MSKSDELIRLERRIAEFEQRMSDIAEPVSADYLSLSGPERAELEGLLTRTLEDMRARRRMLEQRPGERPLES